MLNQAPRGNHEAAESTAPAAAPPSKSQAPCNGAAPDDNHSGPTRETSILGGFLRLAGATAGFLVGGPAGAAFGSAVGELAGDIAAERTSLIWPTLGHAFFLYSKGAHHEEDVCDRSGHDGRHL